MHFAVEGTRESGQTRAEAQRSLVGVQQGGNNLWAFWQPTGQMAIQEYCKKWPDMHQSQEKFLHLLQTTDVHAVALESCPGIGTCLT